MRRVATRHGLWEEAPTTIDPDGQHIAVPVWGPGSYALVVNTALRLLPPVEATLGPEGGQMTFARLTVEVPPGALDSPTRLRVGPPAPPVLPWQGGLPFPFAITTERVADGSPVNALRRPVRLAVTYTSADVGTLPVDAFRLRRLDPETGRWALLPTSADQTAGVLWAETDHLSTFTVAADSAVNPFDFGGNWLKADTFTGDVTMAIPFELPPGPGGSTPDLKLTYDSQASHWQQRANNLSGVNGGLGMQTAS